MTVNLSFRFYIKLAKILLLNVISLLRTFTPHALVPALMFQCVLSMMASVVQHTRLKMRSLQEWFLALFYPLLDLPHAPLRVTPELVSELLWWFSKQNLTIQQPYPKIQVTTNTVLTRWGTHCADP